MPAQQPPSTASGTDRPALPARRSLSHRPAPLTVALVVTLVAIAAVALYQLFDWTGAHGITLGSPAVLTVSSMVCAGLMLDGVQRWIGGGRLDNRALLRIGITFGAFLVLYLTAGWGCVLLGLMPLLLYTYLSRYGSRGARGAIIGAILSTAIAQGMLALGLVASVLPPHVSHAVAVALLVGAVLALARVAASEQQRRAAVAALEHAANHDHITGLANRRRFMARLEAVLLDAAPSRSTTLVLLGFDKLRDVNDRLGRRAGDELLAVVADRIRAGCDGDLAARLGGDVFALLLHPSAVPTTDRARRILRALAAPVGVAGEEVTLRFSIGIATTDRSPMTAEELIRRADVAKSTAEHGGGIRWRTYTAGMDEAANERARIEYAVEQALANDRFRLLYQPIVTLPDGRLTGVEALLRLHEADGTVLGPDRFIPVAEATGLIVPVGRWVLGTACRQAAEWRRRLGDRAPARVNINVSARQLEDPDLFADVARALADNDLPPDAVVIEITETAAMTGDDVTPVLDQLKRLGVGIALDDFGTGYSSLSMLRTCPVDAIKLDKSFVADIERDPVCAALASGLNAVGAALGARVVAEGVETATQVRLLHRMGYRLAQGFHFAHPLTPDQVEDLIAKPALLQPL